MSMTVKGIEDLQVKVAAGMQLMTEPQNQASWTATNAVLTGYLSIATLEVAKQLAIANTRERRKDKRG